MLAPCAAPHYALCVTVPDYEVFMLPVLQSLADAGSEAKPLPALATRVADMLDLPSAARSEKPAWSHETTLVSRTRVTATWLAAAGLIHRAEPGITLTERGHSLLEEKPEALDRESLRRYPEFETYLQAHLARQGA
ncbi:MAG: winged helix-turn-helix domain-containing protein [Myxococcota bacterium]